MKKIDISQIEISQAKNPDLRNSFVALKRAAELARTTAIQTNTGIVVLQDNKIKHISADQLKKQN